MKLLSIVTLIAFTSSFAFAGAKKSNATQLQIDCKSPKMLSGESVTLKGTLNLSKSEDPAYLLATGKLKLEVKSIRTARKSTRTLSVNSIYNKTSYLQGIALASSQEYDIYLNFEEKDLSAIELNGKVIHNLNCTK